MTIERRLRSSNKTRRDETNERIKRSFRSSIDLFGDVRSSTSNSSGHFPLDHFSSSLLSRSSKVRLRLSLSSFLSLSLAVSPVSVTNKKKKKKKRISRLWKS